MLNIHGEFWELGLDAKEQSVLFAIAKRMNKKRESFPSQDTIRKEAGVGRDSIKAALQNLQKAGLISLKKERNSKGLFQKTVYKIKCKYLSVFAANPQTKKAVVGLSTAGKPLTDNPLTDNPQVDKPITKYCTEESIVQLEVLREREEEITLEKIEKAEGFENRETDQPPQAEKTSFTEPQKESVQKEKNCGKKESSEPEPVARFGIRQHTGGPFTFDSVSSYLEGERCSSPTRYWLNGFSSDYGEMKVLRWIAEFEKLNEYRPDSWKDEADFERHLRSSLLLKSSKPDRSEQPQKASKTRKSVKNGKASSDLEFVKEMQEWGRKNGLA